VWFWVTPIVYASALVFDRLDQHPVWKILYLANPMTDVVLGFQRALYGMVSPVVVVNGVPTPQPVLPDVSVAWLALLLTAVSAGCIALFLVAWRSFFHLSGDFAEEL